MRSLELKIHPPDVGGEFLIVELVGYLDADTVQLLNQRVSENITGEVTCLIFQLEQLVYISSAGIGAFMGWAQMLRESGGRLVLVQPSTKIYKILELLGFTRVVDIVNSLEEAFVPKAV